MTALRGSVKRAQHRLWLNRWLSGLGWFMTGNGIAFVLLVIVARRFHIFREPDVVLAWCALGAAGMAMISSLIWTILTRDNLTVAAARLDQAAGLKERLSSAMFCATTDDPFAKAVVADAEKIGRGLTVGAHMPVRYPVSVSFAGGTLAVALLMFWLLPAAPVMAMVSTDGLSDKDKQELVQEMKATLQPVANQIRKLGNDIPELKDELDKLDEMDEARLDTPLDVRREAIKKVQSIADKLEERQKDAELGKVDEFRKIMRQIAAQQKPDTAVGQLAKALARGDMEKAKEALEDLKNELAKAPKTPEEQAQAKELKEQLEQLSKKIEQAASDQKKNAEDLAKAGLTPEQVQRALEQLSKKDTEAVKEQLAKQGMNQQQIQQMMQQLQKRCEGGSCAKQMAQNLSKAAQGSNGAGQLSQPAQEGLKATGEQLSEMEALQQQMSQLSSTLSDLKNMQNQLGQGCSQCNGTGMKNGQPCGKCNGSGMGQNPGQGSGQGSGMGPNPGQGEGNVAQKAETDYKTVMKRTEVHTEAGRIISQQFVDGEQFKGEVSHNYVEAAIAREREVTDAIDREQIPRVYHTAIKKFFDRERSALPADKVKAVDAEQPEQ